MARLNLQLFAKLNTNTSVVDYLKSQGQDSSYSARKKLASEYGISNYTGSEQQNIELLKKLKVPAQQPSITVPSDPTPTTPVAQTQAAAQQTAPQAAAKSASQVTAISGVDQSLVDKINSSYTESDKVTNAKSEADASLDKVKEMANQTDIIDQSTWDALNTPFQSSEAYNQAMQYTNSLLEQLSSGRTSYTDQIKELMGQIQNREAFEYDVDSDTMFQQALASAMSSGKSAMQDTMGQAAALTGGYGSTYATSAANQAYNSFIEDAYNNLPEYYQMALEAYQMEGQEMYNQLAMLSDADATEYQRMYDSWSANFSNAQQMYNQEYGQWQDSVNNAYNSASLQLSEHGQLFNQAYSTYTALADQANTLYEHEYNKWADEVNAALNYAGMQNSDYWINTNYNESVRQYNESLAWEKDSFAQQMAENQRQHEAEMNYKYSALAQDQAQFDATMAYNKSKSGSSGSKSSGGSGSSGSEYKTPTETQKKKALEAFNTGGESAYYEYLDSLPSNIDVGEIDAYVNGDGNGNQGYGQLPLSQRTFTVIDDGGINWFGGVDGNVVVKDQYGNEYKLSDIKKTDSNLAKELSKLGKGATYTAKK